MTNANSGTGLREEWKARYQSCRSARIGFSEAAALAGHQPDSNATASIDRTAAAVAKLIHVLRYKGRS